MAAPDGTVVAQLDAGPGLLVADLGRTRAPVARVRTGVLANQRW
ncbi:hypothetical protein [Saccharopolyspora shandongensis]